MENEMSNKFSIGDTVWYCEPAKSDSSIGNKYAPAIKSMTINSITFDGFGVLYDSLPTGRGMYEPCFFATQPEAELQATKIIESLDVIEEKDKIIDITTKRCEYYIDKLAELLVEDRGVIREYSFTYVNEGVDPLTDVYKEKK